MAADATIGTIDNTTTANIRLGALDHKRFQEVAPWAGGPGAWETAVMRQSARRTRARRADRKSRPAIFYIERNPKTVQSIATFRYIARSL